MNATRDELITLDISGERSMKVSRSILTRVKGSALEAMFSGRHTLRTVNGSVFIDRDADIFPMVVSYLRNGLSYPDIADSLLRERFTKELDYWSIGQPKRCSDELAAL